MNNKFYNGGLSYIEIVIFISVIAIISVGLASLATIVYGGGTRSTTSNSIKIYCVDLAINRMILFNAQKRNTNLIYLTDPCEIANKISLPACNIPREYSIKSEIGRLITDDLGIYRTISVTSYYKGKKIYTLTTNFYDY